LIKKKTTPKELRNFGFMMGGVFPILFGLLIPWKFHLNYPVWPWALGAFFLGFALLVPTWLYYIHKAWMKFGEFLGAINSRIIMGFIFFFLFVPVAVLMKLLKRDAMTRQFEKRAESYRVLRKDLEIVARMERMF
jgi:hypothetical protein